MGNFGLLNKSELSYVLNNEKEFGSQLIKQIEDYCISKKYSISKIKEKKPSWNELYERVIITEKENEIIISKTDESKKIDRISLLIFIVSLGIIILANIWRLLRIDDYGFDAWYALIVMPLIAFFFFTFLKDWQIKEQKNKNDREVIILKNLEIQFVENGEVTYTDEINAVNLFWRENTEANTPTTDLELRLKNRKVLEIDNQGGHLELLRGGNQIAVFLNKKLHVFKGRSPFYDKDEL